MTTETRTSKLDHMSDVELLGFFSSPSEESQELLTSMAQAQAAGAELSPGELRLQKVMDDAVDEFVSWDKERKRTALDEFIQYLTRRREDLLTMTWVFNHSTELYRWVERLEAK
jgi:hypothetical protein